MTRISHDLIWHEPFSPEEIKKIPTEAVFSTFAEAVIKASTRYNLGGDWEKSIRNFDHISKGQNP